MADGGAESLQWCPLLAFLRLCATLSFSSLLNFSWPCFWHCDALLIGPLAVRNSKEAKSRFAVHPAAKKAFPAVSLQRDRRWISEMIGLACKKCAFTLQVAHANDTCKSRENTPNCLYRLAVYVSFPLSLGNEQTTSRSHQVFGVLYSLDLTIIIVDG